MARIGKSGSFVITIAPLSNDEQMSYDSGNTTRGFLAIRNIASPGDHKTLNTSLRLRIIPSHFVAFCSSFDLAFSHNAGRIFGARLVQVGTNGKSYQRDGTNNTDFHAYRLALRLVYVLLRNPVFFIPC